MARRSLCLFALILAACAGNPAAQSPEATAAAAPADEVMVAANGTADEAPVQTRAASSSPTPAAARPLTADPDARAVAVVPIDEVRQEAQQKFGKVDNNWLIAIGVNEFDDESVSTLRFCVNDARAIYDFFTSNGYVPQSRAYLLVSGSPDPKLEPTRNNIMRTVAYAAKNAGKDSTIILHFSGHGFTDEKSTPYLLPQDGQVQILKDTAVNLDRINEMLEGSQARRKIVFADACRNAARTDHKGVEVSSSEAFLKALARSEGQITLASCGVGQFSYEMGETGYGAFTHFLLKGLRGSAPPDDNGLITINSVARYVGSRVYDWSLAQQKPVPQQPWTHGEESLLQSIPLAVAEPSGVAQLPPPPSVEGNPYFQAGGFTAQPVGYPGTQQPLQPGLSEQAIELEVEEKGDARELAGLTRDAFTTAFTDAGFNINEGDAGAALQFQPAYKVRVTVNFSYRTMQAYGVVSEKATIRLSTQVVSALTGETFASVKPRTFGLTTRALTQLQEMLHENCDAAAQEAIEKIRAGR